MDIASIHLPHFINPGPIPLVQSGYGTTSVATSSHKPFIHRTRRQLVAAQRMNWKKAVEIGQFGGDAGRGRDDGHNFTSIRQLIVRHGAAIDSIQIEYDVDGSSFWTDIHGGNGGKATASICFNHPREILTSMSGYVCKTGEFTVISSLKFETNLRKYGPYGEEKGMYFSIPKMGGKIVGFYGKSGWLLDSIGVYYRLPKMLKPPSTSNNLEHNSMAALKLHIAAIQKSQKDAAGTGST